MVIRRTKEEQFTYEIYFDYLGIPCLTFADDLDDASEAIAEMCLAVQVTKNQYTEF